MPIKIVYNPPDTIRRMQEFPQTLEKEMKQAHADSLTAVHEAVPPYPAQPAGSKYIRTERLGQGLGSGFSGGKHGAATIYNTTPMEQGGFTSEFGSNAPYYNEYVIGEATQAAHMRHWWRINEPLLAATNKIVAAFEAAAERIAKHLNG